MRKKLSTVVGIIIILILFIICLVTILTEDKEAPTIVFEEDQMIYIEGDDIQDLLENVKAIDEIEGDVTDSLMVESVSVLTGEEKAKVVFVAKDSKNNIVKAGIIVQYKKKRGRKSWGM